MTSLGGAVASLRRWGCNSVGILYLLGCTQHAAHVEPIKAEIERCWASTRVELDQLAYELETDALRYVGQHGAIFLVSQICPRTALSVFSVAAQEDLAAIESANYQDLSQPIGLRLKVVVRLRDQVPDSNSFDVDIIQVKGVHVLSPAEALIVQGRLQGNLQSR